MDLEISHWAMHHSQVYQLKYGNQIKILVESNQHYVMKEIAAILQISKSSIENHLLCPIRIRDAWYTALVSLNNREKKGGERLILITLSGSSYLRRLFHLRRNT